MPKKNKIVYKYEGGPRPRASDTMPMPKYKTLKRCHLPDLDLTVPVSRGVTWGRPVTQEEIDDISDVFGFSLTQEEIDDMRACTQADAGVNEVKSEATIERMNAVFGAQHDHRLYIEFKWHRMVMRLLERE